MPSIKTIAWLDIILGIVVLLVPFGDYNEVVTTNLSAAGYFLWLEVGLGIIVLIVGILAYRIKSPALPK
jgi:hypothetical protein